MKPPKRPHILYVEDDKDSCSMMTVLLAMSNIDVSCAHGVAQALNMPDKGRFDLFLLDLWLHDGDGKELCVKLRSQFPDIPVVFYTGCASQTERKEGMVSGAAAYLVKPYSEFVAPMIFRLVKSLGPISIFDRPTDPVERPARSVSKLIHIVSSAGRPLPLSP